MYYDSDDDMSDTPPTESSDLTQISKIYSVSKSFTYEELRTIERFINIYGLHSTKELDRRLKDYHYQDDELIRRVLNRIIDKHLNECNNTIGKETLTSTTIEGLKESLIRDVISQKSCDVDRYYLGDPCSTSMELYKFRCKIIKEFHTHTGKRVTCEWG